MTQVLTVKRWELGTVVAETPIRELSNEDLLIEYASQYPVFDGTDCEDALGLHGALQAELLRRMG